MTPLFNVYVFQNSVLDKQNLTIKGPAIHDQLPGADAVGGWLFNPRDVTQPPCPVHLDLNGQGNFYGPSMKKSWPWKATYALLCWETERRKPRLIRKGSKVLVTEPELVWAEYVVGLNLPNGADIEDGREYIEEWVASGKGCLHTEHPMHHLDPKSVKVTVR